MRLDPRGTHEKDVLSDCINTTTTQQLRSLPPGRREHLLLSARGSSHRIARRSSTMTALSSLASASLSSSRGSRRARRDGGTRVRPCCAFVRRKTRSVCRLGSTWRVLSAASAFSGGGDDGGRSGFAQPSLAAGSFRAPPEVGRSSPDDAAQDTRTSYAHTSVKLLPPPPRLCLLFLCAFSGSGCVLHARRGTRGVSVMAHRGEVDAAPHARGVACATLVEQTRLPRRYRPLSTLPLDPHTPPAHGQRDADEAGDRAPLLRSPSPSSPALRDDRTQGGVPATTPKHRHTRRTLSLFINKNIKRA